MMLRVEEARKSAPTCESLFSLRLKEWAEQIPVIKLPTNWERNILELVPSELRKRHPRRVETTLREIRKIYEDDMRNSAIDSIVPKIAKTDDDVGEEAEQKLRKISFSEIFITDESFARGEKCYSMTRQRALLAEKYHLSHGIMRLIIATANSTLPPMIVHLGDYRKIGLYELSEFQDATTRSVKQCAATIVNDYYREIVTAIASSYSRHKTNFKERKMEKFLNCATNLFAQQIIEIMMNTIDDLIQKLSDYQRQSHLPRFRFKLVWNEDRLMIDPPINQVHYMWHRLIDSIENVANRLPSFRRIAPTIESSQPDEMDLAWNTIKIKLPDWYTNKCHDKVDEIMKNLVGPLEEYFDSVVKQFGAVTSVEMRKNMIDLASKGRNFDVFCINVKRLNQHYEGANEMMDSVEYAVGRLSQTEAKIRLKEYISKMRNVLVDKLLLNHEKYNKEICDEFQELKDRMLDIPTEAQALFQLSETLSCASRLQVEKLEKRVKKSIEMLSSLVELTSDMSEEHMSLNATTINWLAEIKPIFNKSNTLCEAMKSELEDELQRQINQLNSEIDAIIPKFQILDDMDDADRVEEYAEHLDDLVANLDQVDRHIERINFEERLFKFPETDFPSVEEIRDILMPVKTLNSLMCEWRRDHSVWLDGPFEYIDAELVGAKTIGYHEQFGRLNTSLKAKIKAEMQSSAAANKPFKFSGVVDDPDPMQQPAPLKLCWQVLQDVEKFKDYLELIVCMCNPALCDRHWEEMSAIYHGDESFRNEITLDKLITPNAGTTLRKLIALDLNKDIAKYQVISIGANKELRLAQRLDRMILTWEAVDFTIVTAKLLSKRARSMSGATQEEIPQRKNRSIFSHLDEIQILMNEHSVVIREMKVSYFVKPIATKLTTFSLSLVSVRDTIDYWLHIQNEWFNLEPVFRTAGEEPGNREELREAGEIFLLIHDTLQTIEEQIIRQPKFRQIAEKSLEFLQLLRDATAKLETVKETVGNYLQRARGLYPRFFFLSDSRVMKILFEPIFPKRIKLLLNNCFTDIRSIRLGRAPESAGIASIIDSNDQQLSLLTESSAEYSSKSAELIDDTTISSFVAIENSIKRAVRESIRKSFHDYNEEPSLQPPNSSLLMSALCGLRMYWTLKVEEAFLNVDPTGELESYQKRQSLFLNSMLEDLRSNLSRKRRTTLVATIIQVRQQQDIIGLLLSSSSVARTSRNFNWKAQVRHYWKDNEIEVMILDTKTRYGYEYSVFEKPIINTPLTDRCYLSLMEAHRNQLYGALFGPEASSKSQCIKSLARTLGISLRVFNCHEKVVVNHTYIGNYLKGLVGCSPCWLCFKNLDHLTVQVQSVLAQRISSIRQILISARQSSTTVEFQGSSLKLRDRDCCFISCTVSTMCPKRLNRGASEFQRLTDSLKTLFRPIAMMIPDRRRIIEVELFAEAFADAAILAEKMHLVETYAIGQFASTELYDFSARTTMTVVKTACALKYRYPEDAEDSLLLRALLDVHLPKLKGSDVLVFHNIIDTVFPKVELPPSNYSELLSAMEQVCHFGASTSQLFRLKMIQLFETLLMRHSIIVVGPSLSGKTSIIDGLAATLSFLNTRESDQRLPAVESMRINHIALSSEEFFGRYEVNISGRANWKDGIFTKNLRSFAENAQYDRKLWSWIILDGPLDTFFIEKLSPLLDENKTLFLTSGESIRMTDSMSVIIETTSLKKASPATVSRCGVIYIEQDTIGLKGQIDQWIAQRTQLFPVEDENDRGSDEQKYLTFFKSLLEWSLAACLSFIDVNTNNSTFRLSIMMNKNHLIFSVLTLVEIYLRESMGDRGETCTELGSNSRTRVNTFDRGKMNMSQLLIRSQAALIMAIAWGLGGALSRQSRVALDEFYTALWRDDSRNPTGRVFPYRATMKQYELPLPSEGLIEDHVYVFSGTGSWRNWSDILKKDSGQWLVDSTVEGQLTYVPTVESIRYVNIFEIHLKYRKPFIISGETATGKTVLIRHLLKKKICQRTTLSNFITLGGSAGDTGCSGYRAQQIFLSKLTKLKMGVYGPGKSRLCTNFVDDLNIAASNNAENVAALELMRQYYDNDEWHDVDTGNKIRLEGVMFLAALSQDRSNEWTSESKWRETRLFRHFNIYNVDGPSRDSIFKIYYNILLANLRVNQFNADVSGSVTSMVNATIDLFASVRQKLKPVPGKFQYQFSLRDVGRVMAGCGLIHKESVETKITLIRLWVHEALRVFADRIVEPEDADWLLVAIREAAGLHFKDPFEAVFDNLPKSGTDELTRESFGHLVFSDLMQAESLDHGGGDSAQTPRSTCNSRKRYEEVTCCRETLRNKAMACLKRYNDSVAAAAGGDDDDGKMKKLEILIVSGLLEHLLRISRVLGTSGGSLLMICFGGSGRRSLTALAAHVKGQRLHELSYRVSSGSLTNCWRRDVKKACTSCVTVTAPRGTVVIEDCTFFINDRQIFGSSRANILGDICNLMKTGQVMNLFTNEERDEIVERSRLLAQHGDRNLEIDSLSVMDYFYQKCQEKLHFVLYFNLADERKNNFSMASECDSTSRIIFNSIVSHCAIDCYECWPEQAFTEIASKFVTEIEMDKDSKFKAIAASKCFYDSVENKWYPRHEMKIKSIDSSSKRLSVAAYLHMMKLYGFSMYKRQKEIRATRKRYLTGLEKLELAGDQVKEMKVILTSLRPQLELSARETEDTMRKIEKENASVETATVQVKQEEAVANRIAEVAGILKEECEADLAVAIPILEDAVAALNTLKPTDITLVKAMKNPPDTVKLVLAAVCVMLNVMPDRSVDPVTGKKSIDYWAPSKRILGDMNFLQSLKDYDKDNIPSSIMQVVNKTYMTDENFMPHIVVKASSAAEGLCKWVRAMVSYDEVAKVVAPKKEKLAAAEKECNASLEYLNEQRKSLQTLNDRLAGLNVVLAATLQKKLQLENQVANCTNKLMKAEGLLTSLAGEKDRWHKSAETLERSYDCLAGDLLLSCALVAFLGIEDANKRDVYLVDWRNKLRQLSIPNSGDSYDFVGSLEVESRVNAWHNLGLSNNKFSDENATIASNSLLWPLFIDPQNEANLWIRRMEAANKLRIVKATNPRWLGEIRAALDERVPVLVENLEQSKYLDTAAIDYLSLHLCPRHRYFPLLASNDKTVVGRRSNFRLYATSRVSLREAWFGPRLYKLMSVINYSLADEALENQLLEIIVSREKPDLQDKFERSMLESTRNKRDLRREEDNVLSILSRSSVNIVEDESAIEALDYSKNLSLEIMRREETARAMNRRMNEFKANYRPLTNYCAALYDTLASLTNLNHMYRFSLNWFTRLYVRSIGTSMKSVILEKRLNYLKSSFTATLHTSVRNALLDNHKLVYSFLLALKTRVDSNEITPDDIKSLRSVARLARSRSSVASIAARLSEYLPSVFGHLPESLDTDGPAWRAYCQGDDESSINLPAPWNELTTFHKLVLLTGIKPEKTVSRVIELVETSLETKLHSMTQYNVSSSYEESSCLIPLLFILPCYHEVHRIVERFAKTIGYSSAVSRFSMGSADDDSRGGSIDTAIEDARRYGGWIILENCHLASDEALARIEQICESLDPANTVLGFRLWLTSYSNEIFPISIIQNSVKIHWEKPSDHVRECFLRYYRSEPLDRQDFYNTRTGKNKILAKLVYSICFFHTIVRGREKFGTRGWNSPSYEFTDCDLGISLDRLKIFVDENMLEETHTILDSLKYLMGECYYGGRILDPLDRSLLNTILQDYCDSRIVETSSDYVLVTDEMACRRYTVPNRSEYNDYMKHIEASLPIGESSARVFSLDDDAATVRNERNAEDFLRSFSRIYLDEKKYIFRDTDDIASIIGDIRTKLLVQENSQDLNILDATKKYPIIPTAEPLNALLIEEIKIYNRMMEIIRDSIVDVERTYFDGLAPIFLTLSGVYELAENLVKNRVPLEWIIDTRDRSPGEISHESLSKFIDNLPKRRKFLTHWTKTGHGRTNFWLGGIVRRQTFMSSARLTLARKNCTGELSHRLVVDYEVLKTLTDSPWEVAVDETTTRYSCETSDEFPPIQELRIDGLFLSGARWDLERATLVETLPGKLRWSRMPAIRLTLRSLDSTIENASIIGRDKFYPCPVKNTISHMPNAHFFGTFSSTNCIATVPLETRHFPPQHWIKRTTALFCYDDSE